MSSLSYIACGYAMLGLAGCSLLFGSSDEDAGPNDRDGAASFQIAKVQTINLYPDIIRMGEFAQRQAIYEGVGTSNGAPVLVLLTGTLIPQDLEMTIEFSDSQLATPADSELAILSLQVSGDGTMAALEVSVNVIPSLDETRALALRLTGGTDVEGAPAGTIRLLEESFALVGLPEFTLTDSGGGEAKIDSAVLAPLYSDVQIDQNLTIRGDVFARFRSTAAIRVSGVVNVSGEVGAREFAPLDGGLPGPGGCAGGVEKNDALCPPQGGLGAGSMISAGGSGGGHSVAGDDAEPGIFGDPVIAGGLAIGDRLFSSGLTAGGGGGSGGRGAGGGGGGGGLLLWARGALDLVGASILCNGGTGGDGGVSETGGGGAGGGVWLRSEFEIATDLATVVSVSGGEGNFGSAGAPGRVRIDSTGPSPASMPEPAHGSVLLRPDSPIVLQEKLVLTVAGVTTTANFIVTINDAVARTQNLVFENGLDEIADVRLELGLNHICGFSPPADSAEIAKYCIDMIRLP